MERCIYVLNMFSFCCQRQSVYRCQAEYFRSIVSRFLVFWNYIIHSFYLLAFRLRYHAFRLQRHYVIHFRCLVIVHCQERLVHIDRKKIKKDCSLAMRTLRQQTETTYRINGTKLINRTKIIIASICCTHLSSSERYQKLISLSSVFVTLAVWWIWVSHLVFVCQCDQVSATNTSSSHHCVRYCIPAGLNTC